MEPVGVFSFAFEQQSAATAQQGVGALADMGYGAVWFPEARGKEAFTHAGMLLAAGTEITVATGIASIWARDAMAAKAAANTLAEAYPGRFMMGLGVSHQRLVREVRGHDYRHPVQAMEAYLDALDAAPYDAVAPATPAPVVLAALGPRMLDVAARRTAGAHTYFVPVEHTIEARVRLGPGPLLAVEIAGVIDHADADAIARAHTSRYLGLENYRNNLRRLGWSDVDLAGPGSDRLVDALVAIGSAETVAERVRLHREAGADHVCVQLLAPDRAVLDLVAYKKLAAALFS